MTNNFSNSMIRQLILEAEEFTLSPDTAVDASNPMDSGTGVSDVAFPAGSPAPGSQTQIPPVSMPQPDASAPTAVTKTVINADLILTHLSELKSIINNYEKRFGGDDIGVEDARVYISSFLNAMAYHSEKLQTFLNIPTENKEDEVTALPEEEPETLGEPSLDIEPQREQMPEIPEINTDFELEAPTEKAEEEF